MLKLPILVLFGFSFVDYASTNGVERTATQKQDTESKQELTAFEVPVPYDTKFAYKRMPRAVRPQSGELKSDVRLPSGDIVSVEQFRMKTVAADLGPLPSPRNQRAVNCYSAIGFSFAAGFSGTSVLQHVKIRFSPTRFNYSLIEHYKVKVMKLRSLKLGKIIPCANEGLYCYNRTRDNFCAGYLEYIALEELDKKFE